jgi:uncharacterized protein (TIGR04222 family)
LALATGNGSVFSVFLVASVPAQVSDDSFFVFASNAVTLVAKYTLKNAVPSSHSGVNMTTDCARLRSDIESFDIDGGTVGLPFAARLARENGWSRSYAERVIVEYKRFVFLAMVSETPVCPSEDVDAAWHLHLTYTRSYWKRFCEGVLGRPLHHEPTKGGPAEHEKHLGMYERTLALYRATFGEDAPRDIWSPIDARFGADLAHRVVNTARNWVIPKAPIKRIAQFVALFAVVAVCVPGCEGGLNPFSLDGTDFFYFLIPMLLAAVCLGRVIRASKRGPEPDPHEKINLNWEQAAYLAGGAARLTTAAIARLVSCGAGYVQGTRLSAGSPATAEGATEVERTVLLALPVENARRDLAPVVRTVDAVYADEAQKLETEGLLVSKSTRVSAGFLAVLPLLLVLGGFAVPRYLGGIANDKPSSYLLTATIAGFFLGLAIIFASSIRLTRKGEHALLQMKERRQKLLSGTTWENDNDAALAVALFGTIVLAGSSIAMLADWYPRQSLASSSGCGTSGCATGGCSGGAGGCGGGGDGGGGCGGGGCGGCGGGGD